MKLEIEKLSEGFLVRKESLAITESFACKNLKEVIEKVKLYLGD